MTRDALAALKHQKPAVLWFTGLSGAGKSTIANLVEQKLHARGVHTALLDGDNVRHGLNKDLGFTAADRVENIRRVAEVARLMTDAGLIVLTSFISPFRAERQLAREIAAEGEFFEIYVDTAIAEAIRRDPKGLYKRALAPRDQKFPPASTSLTRRRRRRSCASTRPRRTPRRAPTRSSHSWRRRDGSPSSKSRQEGACCIWLSWR